MNKKILVTGAKGQLGSELKNLSNTSKQQFTFIDIEELDLSKKEAIYSYFSTHQFDYIVNCAAYTAVDKAEENSEMVSILNRDLPETLAEISKKYKSKLIHISTDYVFNGNSFAPYKESDPTNPQSIYGHTKLAGEKAIEKAEIEAIIIRTSWLYSSFGNNFAKTMIRLGNERPELGVIFDQIGTPTYAHDLAKGILQIIEKDIQLKLITKPEIYHFSNEGVCSWYDFAVEIMNIKKIKCEIKPLETFQYPTPAKRPFYSVLNKSKIKKDFDLEIPHWRESLKACLNLLNQ